MFHFIDTLLFDLLGDTFITYMLIGVITLFVIALLSFILYFIFTSVVKRVIKKAKKKSTSVTAQSIINNKLHKQFFVLSFAFLLSAYADRFKDITKLVSVVALYTSIICLMLILSNCLDVVVDYYSTKSISKKRPIKGPLQIIKYLIYCVFGLIVIATLINQSPLVLISGIGTFTAILSIVFKDALLGLVAGVQITSENLLQIGDWVSIPSENVEGSITDIALVSVKVTAFDNTVYTIPAYTFLSTPFKNWHQTIKKAERQVNIALTVDAMSLKKEEDGSTNLTKFRSDLTKAISEDPHLNKKYSVIVKSKASTTGLGIPVEVYFTTDVADYTEYCNYTSEWTEKALAMLPDYGLVPYQTRINTLT